MKKNVGGIDRAARIIIGLLLLILSLFASLGPTAGIMGAFILTTGFLEFCPLYMPLGIETNREKEKEYFCCPWE